jgi:tetratricopeptide (TPR) repeat protein
LSQGAVQDRTLPRLLSAKELARASGIVTATRGKLKRLFCIEEGWLVFAASNLIEEQLDEQLVRSGALTPSERTDAALEAKRTKKKIAVVLREGGAPSPEALKSGMEELIRSLLSSCLEWPDGEYQFSPGVPGLQDEVTVRLSPSRLILAHASRFPSALDAVRVRIGPPDFRPERTENGERMLEVLEPSGAVGFLMEASDGAVPVSDLLAQSPAGDEETLRALYGLLLLGVVDQATDTGKRRRVPRKEVELTEEECIAVLKRLEGDGNFYKVLGLEHDADREQIRKAYYSVARRYHPDRFRSGDLQGLLYRMEAFFTEVTQAYNTLYNPDLRVDYDRQLQLEAPQAGEVVDRAAEQARQNFLKAKALIGRRRFSEAVVFLKGAIKLDESRAEYHLTLGELLVGNPRMRAAAEEHLIRAAELDPTAPGAYFSLGNLYRKAGRPVEAAKMYRETLRWQDDHLEAAEFLQQLGEAAIETGEGGILTHLFRE